MEPCPYLLRDQPSRMTSHRNGESSSWPLELVLSHNLVAHGNGSWNYRRCGVYMDETSRRVLIALMLLDRTSITILWTEIGLNMCLCITNWQDIELQAFVVISRSIRNCRLFAWMNGWSQGYMASNQNCQVCGALCGHSSTSEWYTTMLGVNEQRHEQIRGGEGIDHLLNPPTNKQILRDQKVDYTYKS